MFRKMYDSTSSWFLLSCYLFSMEAVALFFQYVLGFEPCALCVQIRALILFSLIGTLITFFFSYFSFPSYLKFIFSVLSMVFLAASAYFSYTAYQVELGNIISMCSPGDEFPSWMPLNELFPEIFKAYGSCGKSPEFFYGFTMNEVLLISVLFPLFFVASSILSKITLLFSK